MAEGRIRLTVLGGYLGAGKTTWLRHRLHLQPAHVIVNEAGAAVDDHLLQRAAGLDVIAGGCACCERFPALLAVLHRLADAQSRGAAPREVVLETSGLSNPARIVAEIRADPVLVHHVVLAEVIVLVDALHGLAALAGDPLGQRQVLAADRLVVTRGAADASALSPRCGG